MALSDKQSLRQRMRAERLDFSATAPALTPPREFLERLATPGILAGYVAMRGEADPDLLMHAALDRGWTVALPHVTDRASPMRFLAWRPEGPLVAGPFGLRQPPENAPEARPDIVLTPLLAFDSALNRLGQGAGFYDRAFVALEPVLRIGVAWSIQRVQSLPTDPWDVPLHGVIDEHGWNEPELTA